MPRPYNKKTVNDAIAMLDVYASNVCSVEAAAEAVGVRPSSTAYRVVDTMIDKLADMFPDDRLAYVAGEAAGLLREGWRLGDPIESHPNTQVTTNLKNLDAILREHYPADVIDVLASAPPIHDVMFGGNAVVAPGDPAHTMVGPATMPSAWEVGHCASDEPKDTTVQSAPEALADALDAVEEPTDEMIAGVETGTDAEIETKEDFGFDYGASDLDTTEPSE